MLGSNKAHAAHRASEIATDLTHRAGVSMAHVAQQIAEAVTQHPGVTATGGIAMSIVAVLQSAQEVVSTVIALITSLGGLAMALVAMRSAWKKWRKPGKGTDK